MRLAAPVDLEFPMPEVVAVVVSVYISLSNQRRRRNELNRRRPAYLALFDSRLLRCPTWKSFAIEINHEAVGYAAVRRAIIQRDAGHERRLKPAAMFAFMGKSVRGRLIMRDCSG